METKEGKHVFEFSIAVSRPAAAVWSALTEKAIIDSYYMVPVRNMELSPGGNISYGHDSDLIFGRIHAVNAPLKLVHSFNFAGSPDPETVVSYEVMPLDAVSCTLFITHSGFVELNQTWHDISGGWPVIGAALKQRLESTS